MADEPLKCLVEIPKGSRNKYEYDHDEDCIKLDRFLFSSMVYPTDYGFIPETLGLDGDPLDAMVCVSEPTFPGCMIHVKPIALFRMEDDKGIDDKVLCVPLHDPAWNTLAELEDLPEQLRAEIAHFFSVYKDLEQKKVRVDGWYSREDALTEIEAARERLRKSEDGGSGSESAAPRGAESARDALSGAEPVEELGKPDAAPGTAPSSEADAGPSAADAREPGAAPTPADRA